MQEEGITEKYHLHISELNSKAPEEFNLGVEDSICFNTETERPQYFYEEDTYEMDAGSENLEPSEHAMSKLVNFEKINRLGDKRRSKSILHRTNGNEKSHVSDELYIENSPPR